MCEFCNKIYTADEVAKEFNKLNDFGGYSSTSFFHLGKDDNNQIVLYSLNFVDDCFYSFHDCLLVKYCPMCGRRLNKK